MKKLLREPLFHFVLLGAGLFVAWQYTRPATGEGAPSTEIQLSLEEITQQALLFRARWNRDPTPDELMRLMENRIQEEVLYREALALGLDKDDTIVRRRMAQKMQFLAEDVAAAREPSTEELRAWYAKNSRQFAMPARYSFRHLYFSPDHRGAHAREDAERALVQLAGQPGNTALGRKLADPFMFQDYYGDKSPDFLGKEFGPQFTLALADLATGRWQGPVESGYGWHLVFVDTVVPGRVPEFEEVIPDVRTAWLADRKATAWNAAYAKMRAKYTVLLPTPPDQGAAATAVSPSGVADPGVVSPD